MTDMQMGTWGQDGSWKRDQCSSDCNAVWCGNHLTACSAHVYSSLMLTYINKASSHKLQHPAKRGSKPLFAISACYVCGGNLAYSGRKEGRKVGADRGHRRGVKRRRLSCKCRCVWRESRSKDKRFERWEERLRGICQRKDRTMEY